MRGHPVFAMAVVSASLAGCAGGGSSSASHAIGGTGGGASAGGSGGGGGGAAATTLFADDFSRPLAPADWGNLGPVVVINGVLDTTAGNPAPSLELLAGAGSFGNGVESDLPTIRSFDPAGGLTISVDLGPVTPGTQGTAGIGILQSSGLYVVDGTGLTMTVDPSGQGVQVASRIASGDPLRPALVASTPVYVAGTGFHTCRFTVDAAGNATWSVDGRTIGGTSGFAMWDLYASLRLYAPMTPTTTGFRFDNVSVTKP